MVITAQKDKEERNEAEEDAALFDDDDGSWHSSCMKSPSSLEYMYIDGNSKGNYRMNQIAWMRCYVAMMMQRSVRVFRLCHFMHRMIDGDLEPNIDSEIKCLKDMKASIIVIKPHIVILTEKSKRLM